MPDKKSFSLKRRRDKVALGMIIAIILLVVGPWLWFRYEDAQFDEVFNRVTSPSWEELGREKFGSRLCTKVCPGESRSYRVQMNRDEVISIFKQKIQESDFKVTRQDDHCGERTKNEITSTICSVRGERNSLYLALSLNVIDVRRSRSAKDGTYVGVQFGHDSYIWGFFKSN